MSSIGRGGPAEADHDVNGPAVAGVVFGMLAVLLLIVPWISWAPAIAAVCFGEYGLRVADRTRGPRGAARAAVAIGYGAIAAWVPAMVVWAIAMAA